MRPLLRLLGILRLFAGEVVLSIFLGIAAIAAGIGLLGTSAHIIASAALHPSIATLQVAIVGVRFFGISRGVFRYLERLVSHSVNLKMVTRLREDFYLRIEPGAPANLVTLRGGDVLQRVMGDLEVLENFYVRVLSPMVIALVIVIGTSLFIGTYAVELGFLLFTGMVITGFIQPLIALLLTRKTSESLVRLNAESSAKWVEMLQGLEDIQACNAQRYTYTPLMEDIALAGKLQKRLSVLNGLNSGLGLLLMNLTLLAVLWVAIPIVNTGGFSGVSLAVITLITLASFEAVNPLPAAAHQLSASIVAARRLFSPVGDEQNQLVRVDSELTSVQGIKLEGISLSYPGSGEKVLDGVEFKLKKGQKIALLGTSGAGKTSLINILVGFQHAQTGTFTVDGVDVKDVDPDAVLGEAVDGFVKGRDLGSGELGILFDAGVEDADLLEDQLGDFARAGGGALGQRHRAGFAVVCAEPRPGVEPAARAQQPQEPARRCRAARPVPASRGQTPRCRRGPHAHQRSRHQRAVIVDHHAADCTLRRGRRDHARRQGAWREQGHGHGPDRRAQARRTLGLPPAP